MFAGKWSGRFSLLGSLFVAAVLLTGFSESATASPAGAPSPHAGEGKHRLHGKEGAGAANAVVFKQGHLPSLTKKQVFNLSGQYNARIRWTTGGVPHIEANDLEDAAFGEGYAQAKDSVCIIASEILKARSERAQFLGPGPGNINIIKDFSFKAIGLLSDARKRYPNLPAPDHAMLRGFAAGYNKYLGVTDSSKLPPRCAGQPWVRPITAVQLLAYLRIVDLLGSGDLFTSGVTFIAAPPGVNPAPVQVATAASGKSKIELAESDYKAFYRGNEHPMTGSNGWGIGKDMTENGRGALLANPHFPYTGSLRLYQSQITIPGVMNVNGGSLIGFPLPSIAFNKNIAWTHTTSTANHFTVYVLHLKSGDPKTYIKNGKEKPITSKTFRIKVKTSGPQPETLKKTFYYSEYGPMISLHAVNSALPQWGDSFGRINSVAFTYRDANIDTAQNAFAQYLGMDRSANLNQFKSVFADCGTTLWNNTIYTDKAGNAFYTDSSSVPNLSAKAIAAFKYSLKNNPLIKALEQQGLPLLDGSTSRDDWVKGKCNGRVPFSDAPKLQREDFVQNSNNSYWATNPNDFLTGYSPLYGPVRNQLSRRTRMGLTMLTRPTYSGLSNVKPAGDDGKFSAKDIINMLYSDRAYMAETLLPVLLNRCKLIGGKPVDVPNGNPRPVAGGCKALKGWNGVFDLNSAGAGTFRVFMGHYTNDLPGDFSTKFNPKDPINTPGNPKAVKAKQIAKDPMLVSLAQGLNDLDSVNIAYDAKLGDVQYEHTSGGAPPGGTPHYTDTKIPWHGTQNLDGGFNVTEPVISDVAQDTRYPILTPSKTIKDTGQLSTASKQGWQVDRGTSWHFGLEFTDSGPVAYGLLSYSQSTDPRSPHYNDQDRRYSSKDYRKFEYSKSQIYRDPNLTTQTITAKKSVGHGPSH